MSLEQALKENTEAMQELISALKLSATVSTQTSSDASSESKKAVQQKPVKTKKPKATEPEPAAEGAEDSSEVDLEDLRTIARELMGKHGRDKVKEVLSDEGYEALSKVPKEDYAAVATALKAALNDDADPIE